MGHDAFIFAEKSKECFYYDRKYNLLPGTCSDAYDLGSLAYRNAYDRLDSRRQHLASKNDVLAVTDGNIAYWSSEPGVNQHRVSWNADVQEFVKRHAKDEEYFILGDHDDPDCHDVIKVGGFKDVKL